MFIQILYVIQSITFQSFANNRASVTKAGVICLESVNRWLVANKLTLNTTKTEFMLIGSRQKLKTISRSPSLSTNGTPIDQVTTTKSLGVYIDENLSWGNHINKLAKKIASSIVETFLNIT